jgi:flavin reductase (DIM6/NTAB) family NADH-FMN oxidoreductase RutF
MTGHLATIAGVDDPPLYVVTARVGDERSGCVVGFVTQCSIIPERLLVCLSVLNHTFGVAQRTSELAVHLLVDGDEELAQRFGGESGDSTDKFAGVEISEGVDGPPILAGARPWVVGRILDQVGFGDHVGFVLEPTSSGGSGRGTALTSEEVDVVPGHPAEEAEGTRIGTT